MAEWSITASSSNQCTNDVEMLVSMNQDTEIRYKEGTFEEQEFRAVFRLISAIDLISISALGSLDDELVAVASVQISVNGGAVFTIAPQSPFGNFELKRQEINPITQRGTEYVRLRNEYVAVSPWADLDWPDS